VTELGADPSDEVAQLTVELWRPATPSSGGGGRRPVRARVKELEGEVDSHERHVSALVAEVASLRQHLAGLEVAARSS